MDSLRGAPDMHWEIGECGISGAVPSTAAIRSIRKPMGGMTVGNTMIVMGLSSEY